MIAIRELLRLIRLQQATASARMYLWAIERNKAGLAKALAAHDAALADVRIHSMPMRDSEAPAFLRKPDPHTPIARKRELRKLVNVKGSVQ